MNFAKVLDEVARHLDERGERWGVVGAFALHAYGLLRATADLDLVVVDRAQPALIAFLEALGFETLNVSTGYSNHVHPLGALGRIDFVYVDEPTADQLFAQPLLSTLFPGRVVRVPRPEHLAAMKVLAMKNDPSRTFQELADIQFLLSVPGVDEEAVRRAFQKHGLLERFNEIDRIRAARG